MIPRRRSVYFAEDSLWAEVIPSSINLIQVGAFQHEVSCQTENDGAVYSGLWAEEFLLIHVDEIKQLNVGEEAGGERSHEVTIIMGNDSLQSGNRTLGGTL